MVCRWYGEYEILLYTCINVKYFFTEAYGKIIFKALILNGKSKQIFV